MHEGNDPQPPDSAIPPSSLRRALESDEPYAAFARHLTEICGGVDALERLTGEPVVADLTDQPAVPEADRRLVDQVLAAVDAVGRDRLDREYRIVLGRMVMAAATHHRYPLRRRTSPIRLAAALTWIALKGNMDIGRRSRWTGEDIWFWFGVSSCAGVARSIATELGMAPGSDSSGSTLFPSADITLGDVRLLHSRTRKTLIARRDQATSVIEQFEARREAALPMVRRDDGTVELRAREVKVLRALKFAVDGRLKVLVMFGDSIEAPDEIVALSVPDAWHLVAEVRAALDTSHAMAAS